MIAQSVRAIDVQAHPGRCRSRVSNEGFSDSIRTSRHLKSGKMDSKPSYGTIAALEHEAHDPELGSRRWRQLQLDIAASEVRGLLTTRISLYILIVTIDHLSNERTFLASLKFSLFLGVIGLAAFIDFRLPATTNNKGPGSGQARKGSAYFEGKGLALLFFALAFSNLALSTINYYQTQSKYVASHAHVSEHWALRLLLVVTGASIIGSCFVLIEEDR